VLFRTKGEAERYAEAARRELEKLGIDAAPEVVASGVYYQVVFDEKTLTRLAKVDTAVKLAIERLEVLSTPRIAAKPIVATRLDAKPERLVKPKAAAKREELPRPKTATPKVEPVDRVVLQLVDGVASMKLRLTYVMKGDRKITINAVAQFSALGDAEEFRRRLRHSGINASVISKGTSGFEVVVPKDELEKLTPEENEAIKRYLEHVTQTRDEEKRKAVLEKKLRETLGEEYEQWKDHIKITEGGRRLLVTQHLLKKLAKQDPNTAKTLNEKLKNTQKTIVHSADRYAEPSTRPRGAWRAVGRGFESHRARQSSFHLP